MVGNSETVPLDPGALLPDHTSASRDSTCRVKKRGSPGSRTPSGWIPRHHEVTPLEKRSGREQRTAGLQLSKRRSLLSPTNAKEDVTVECRVGDASVENRQPNQGASTADGNSVQGTQKAASNMPGLLSIIAQQVSFTSPSDLESCMSHMCGKIW